MTPMDRYKTAQNRQFEKKLAAYALAGAAAVVAPGTAKANGIQYFPNVDVTVDQTGSYDFNLTGPSSDDITIVAAIMNTGFGDQNEVAASVGTGAQVMMSGTPGDVAALSFGALIDPNAGSGWGSGGKMTADNPTFGIGGAWPSNNTDAYLGFYVNGPANKEAGWADIDTFVNGSTSSFEILSYAIQTTPNTSITAGQTPAVPEPSSMALLAIGGAGLVALRRRRAARQ